MNTSTAWTRQQNDVADSVIEALAGPSARLRDDQRTAVDALLTGAARVLVVQATGWGKSAVYWTATAMLRAQGAGPTLVVSPLLSLMRDQVSAAQRAGLRAATVNSSNVDEWSQIEDDLRAGVLDVLLVSPERLANPGFGARVLDAMAGQIGLLVVDEAHAISDWGHDFRPDYRRVSDVLRELNPSSPVLATTATANARVSADVARQLGESTLVLRGPLARSSLQLNVTEEMTPLDRYAWVAQHLGDLPGSGIVYVLTVADAQRLTAAIRAVHGDAVPVAAYTGQLPPDERHRLEDSLRDNEIKALIATSALGMGYDKPDLGFVVHVGSPPSPVSYYQQVGRAGRAIDHAQVVLLPSASDRGIWDHFATATIPDPEQMSGLLTALADENEPASVVSLEASTGLRRTKIELMLKQLAVDGAVSREAAGWSVTGREWSYDAEHYAGIIATRQREADIMNAYIRGERCLMALLTESLDDPSAAACGRCSVCVGHLPGALGDAPDPAIVRTISLALRSRAHILEPRKMWPGGAFGTRSRIPAHLMAEPGRVLVHADAPEWADTLAAAHRGDAEAITEIGDAGVAALASWKTEWVARPQIVVSMPLTDTRLTEGVADRIAEVGRLPRATQELTDTRRPGRDLSGADEAAMWRALMAPPAAEVSGATVLLVADASTTGWPVTVATAALRSAGAGAVLPLLIHRTV